MTAAPRAASASPSLQKTGSHRLPSPVTSLFEGPVRRRGCQRRVHYMSSWLTLAGNVVSTKGPKMACLLPGYLQASMEPSPPSL